MIDVTTEKEPEPEPVQHQQTVAVITDVLNVVRNDTKIETSIAGWTRRRRHRNRADTGRDRRDRGGNDIHRSRPETLFPGRRPQRLPQLGTGAPLLSAFGTGEQHTGHRNREIRRGERRKADQHTGTEEPRQDALGRSGKRTVQISEMGARPSARRAGAFQLHDAYRIQTPELTIPIR